jgi:DNA polymerase-3 subunit delta
MMTERRVVIVRDVDKLSRKELLVQYVEHAVPSTCLVLVAPSADLRKRPYTSIRKHGVIVRCDALRDHQVTAWIAKRAKDQGRAIESDAAKLLSVYVGTSLMEIQNELHKLYAFIGERKSISADDVRAVVGVSKEFNIFELQNALGRKHVARASEIGVRMIDAGESPVFIIVMLTRFFTTLWKAIDLRRRGTSGSSLATQLGVSPYSLPEYEAALVQYHPDEVEQAFDILASSDEALKSTTEDHQNLINATLVRLMCQNCL